MAKRQYAYEAVFKNVLRNTEVLYLSINESKRPLYGGKTIKNFDFIVSSFKGKYLIEVKGKSFPYGKSGLWENWIKIDDISGLMIWATHFSAFIPLLVYVYHIKDKKYLEYFLDRYEYGNNLYGIVGIELSTYYTHAKTRSKKWNAISVPKDDFKKLIKPISYYIPELRKKW